MTTPTHFLLHYFSAALDCTGHTIHCIDSWTAILAYWMYVYRNTFLWPVIQSLTTSWEENAQKFCHPNVYFTCVWVLLSVEAPIQLRAPCPTSYEFPLENCQLSLIACIPDRCNESASLLTHSGCQLFFRALWQANLMINFHFAAAMHVVLLKESSLRATWELLNLKLFIQEFSLIVSKFMIKCIEVPGVMLQNCQRRIRNAIGKLFYSVLCPLRERNKILNGTNILTCFSQTFDSSSM